MADGIITLNQTWNGKNLKNVIVVSNMVSSVSDFQEAADDIRSHYVNFMDNDLQQGWFINNVSFTVNPGPGQFTHLQDFSLGPLEGLSNGQATANQTSLLVSTSYIGAAPNRGRFYMGGLTETVLSDGIWTPAVLANAENLIDEWATNGIVATGGTMFLRIGRRAADGTISTSNPVDAVFGQPVPATQRRRRRNS